MHLSEVGRTFRIVALMAGFAFALACSGRTHADDGPKAPSDSGPPVAGSSASQPASSNGEFIEVGGGKLYCEVVGEGPALVLLHDGLLHREVWDAQVPALSKNYKVVRYDRRGFGRSPVPKAEYSDLDDLNDLLAALKFDRVVLIGCSDGGALAMDYTVAHPEKVDAVVLVGAVVDNLGYSAHFRRRLLLNLGNDVTSVIDHWANDKYLVSPQNTAARRRLRELLEANPQDLGPEKNQYAKDSGQTGLKRLEKVRVPVLILVGEGDIPDVQAHAGAIESRIRGARRIIVPETGHLVNLEQPDTFNRMVLDFLSLIDRPLRQPRSASDGAASSRRHRARPRPAVAADGAASLRFESGYAPADGTALYYESLGDGPPIVLLHGGLVDHRMWDQQFDALAQRYRVVRYDLRGYGLSKSPPGIYRETDDLRALLKHLNIERAHIMGLSLGGLIGIDFTLENPEMVATLIPVGPGLSGYEFKDADVREQFRQTRLAYMQADWDRVVSLFEKQWVAGPSRKMDEVDRSLVERIHQMGLASFQPGDMGHSQRPQPPAVGRLSEIHAPTFVIGGDLDVPEILKIVDRLANEVEGAKKALVPGAAHMVNMEKPKEFNRLVLDFLATQ